MILKNGKRIDGLGDSMPIGSIIEYNGTDIPDGWEKVAGSDNDKINYIQCGFNEAFWIPDTNYKLLTFNNIRTNGDLFSYDNETNEVVVSETASIDEVKLHFHTMLTTGGELPVEAIEVLVYKNDAIVAIINDGLNTASSRSATSLDYIVDCAPGDRFKVEARSYNNIYQMLATYGRTAFIIEEVADNNIGDLIVEEKQPSAITATYNPTVAGTTGNWKVPETDVTSMYPLNDVVSQTGDGLTLDTTTGNIIVGKNVSTVMVFNKVTYFSTETRMCASYILHNGNVMAQNTFGAIADIFMNINNSVLLNVKEGDTISLSFYGKQGNEVGRNKNSNLTVIEIPDANIIKESSQLNLITDGDPVKAGYKIDGKDVYVKRVFVPSLPNNGLLEPDTGIPSTYDIDYYVGTLVNNNKYTMTVPVEGTNFMRAALDGRSANYVIQITTNSDRTTWKGYFNIYYY